MHEHNVGQKLISCIQSDSTLINPSQKSVLQSEYVGILLFHIIQKAGVHLPGLLPVWGMIGDYDDGEKTDSPTWKSKASIMPLMEIETMEDILRDRSKMKDFIPTALDLVESMSPVLEVLSFLESVGLSFQDVLRKNIGFELSRTGAFLFDVSHLTILDKGRCTIPWACNYCWKDSFQVQLRKESSIRFRYGSPQGL